VAVERVTRTVAGFLKHCSARCCQHGDEQDARTTARRASFIAPLATIEATLKEVDMRHLLVAVVLASAALVGCGKTDGEAKPYSSSAEYPVAQEPIASAAAPAPRQ
jgi:hypothetical protein